MTNADVTVLLIYLAGVVAGVLVTARIVWLLIAPESWGWSPSPYHKPLIPVVGTMTIVLVGLLLGRLTAAAGQLRRKVV